MSAPREIPLGNVVLEIGVFLGDLSGTLTPSGRTGRIDTEAQIETAEVSILVYSPLVAR